MMSRGIDAGVRCASGGAAVVGPDEGEAGEEDSSEHHAPDGEALRGDGLLVRSGDGEIDGWPGSGVENDLLGVDWSQSGTTMVASYSVEGSRTKVEVSELPVEELIVALGFGEESEGGR